jgi:hypothetical protein
MIPGEAIAIAALEVTREGLKLAQIYAEKLPPELLAEQVKQQLEIARKWEALFKPMWDKILPHVGEKPNG